MRFTKDDFMHQLHPEGGPSPCAPTDLEKRVEANEWIGYMFFDKKNTLKLMENPWALHVFTPKKKGFTIRISIQPMLGPRRS